MGLSAIPCLFHTGLRTPGRGEGGERIKQKELTFLAYWLSAYMFGLILPEVTVG